MFGIPLPSIRLSFVLIAVFCGLAIVAALIMEYFFEMEPCPLCISQRVFIILVGFAALLGAALSNKKVGLIFSAGLGIVLAFIGGSISARHVWIQNLPAEEVPICGPGLGYMFETRPLFDALSLLFSGDGHCAEINFSLFGLTIPGWTLVYFLGLAVTLAWLIWRALKEQSAK